MGLEEKSQAYPRQLSGGQKQRVAIARALVLNPEILLCDEATSALDPQITRDILNLLLKINKEMNITIVVVTHQMEVIKQICNKVAFLKDGRVLSVGKPEELFVAPNQEIQKLWAMILKFCHKLVKILNYSLQIIIPNHIRLHNLLEHLISTLIFAKENLKTLEVP